jgi:hypothetical protein
VFINNLLASSAVKDAAAELAGAYLRSRAADRGGAAEGVLPPETEADVGNVLKEVLASAEQAAAQEPTAAPSEVGAAHPVADSVFQVARARIDRALRLNIALAVGLSLILAVGLAGAVISGLVLGRDTAAIVFGGMSLADLLAFAATKPFSLINSSVVESQRLEMAHLRLREQLDECNAYTDAKERFECRAQAWDKMQEELRSLSGQPAP